MVGDGTHPKYEFQYFVSIPMKQNSTNDVELVGTVTPSHKWRYLGHKWY